MCLTATSHASGEWSDFPVSRAPSYCLRSELKPAGLIAALLLPIVCGKGFRFEFGKRKAARQAPATAAVAPKRPPTSMPTTTRVAACQRGVHLHPLTARRRIDSMAWLGITAAPTQRASATGTWWHGVANATQPPGTRATQSASACDRHVSRPARADHAPRRGAGQAEACPSLPERDSDVLSIKWAASGEHEDPLMLGLILSVLPAYHPSPGAVAAPAFASSSSVRGSWSARLPCGGRSVPRRARTRRQGRVSLGPTLREVVRPRAGLYHNRGSPTQVLLA